MAPPPRLCRPSPIRINSEPEIFDPPAPRDVTRLLLAWRAARGGREFYDQLVERLYPELRELAHAVQAGERNGSREPTELLHEAFLKLADQSQLDWQDRAHFMSVAARQMRRILIQDWRRRMTQKRGSGLVVSIAEPDDRPEPTRFDAGEIAEALERLEALNERPARVVELRFLAGLSIEETAEALQISTATVKREWAFARAWLFRELTAQPV